MLDAEEGQQAQLVRRFADMGLRAQPLPGGRSVLVELPFGGRPLDTLGEPRRIRAVRFATAGADRIKCVAPRALFYLPLLRVADCRSAAELEARIREAWTKRIQELRRTQAWLARLGIEPESPRGTPQWVFRLGLEDKQARAAAIAPNQVILPSTGPLSGLPLERPEDRLVHTEPGCASAIDLELAITTRLEELARYAARVRAPQAVRPAPEPRAPSAARTVLPILLVGPRLAEERAVHESLRLRSFGVSTARSIDETLARFAERSFDLVMADTVLDRFEGIELIPELRAVSGIEEIPVVLVDDRPREARRKAARHAGAAGYVVRPLDVPRLAEALGRAIRSPRRRRFRRYPKALSVTWPGNREPGITQNVGRGGLSLRTAGDDPGDDAIPFEIHGPELGGAIRVEGAVVSRRTEGARVLLGVHFRAFAPGGEPRWIAFLRGLDPKPERARAGERPD